ncbi:MAG: phosphatidate cytidylyltransferase [Alkaliphilus sp.]
MLKRTISGLLGALLLIVVVLKGELAIAIGTMVISILALCEFYAAFKKLNTKFIIRIAVLVLIIMQVNFSPTTALPIIIAMIMLFSSLLVFKFEKYNIVDIAIMIFGVLYIGITLGHLTLFANHDYSIMIWFVFIIAWSTDTSAYFSGYLFGNKKLCPSISPKKTVEGAIGGVIGSMLASATFAYFFIPEHLLAITFLGFLGSILSQIGDLIASSIKRHVGIKDFGNVLPGHGGVLDRFDSIILTAPTVYYFMLYIIG